MNVSKSIQDFMSINGHAIIEYLQVEFFCAQYGQYREEKTQEE